MSYTLSRVTKFLSLPFSVQWRAYLVRLPWLVPLPVLHYTSPEGPYPAILQLPSRGRHHIPCYLFFPPNADPRDGAALPVHLDFHGGGFIMGSCLEQAPFCARLARTTNRLVISVDYRKGPLDKFPAAIEDGEDVLAAVLDSEGSSEAGRTLRDAVRRQCSSSGRTQMSGGHQIDPSDVSLSGFSSGGNLALNLVLSVRTEQEGAWPSLFAREGKPIPTLLFYPSLDCRQLPHERPRPEKLRAREADSSTWFPNIGSVLGPTYLPHHARSHARASPGLNDMRECLNTRARIRLVLPEVDTLAHQSELWVREMEECGYGEEGNKFVVAREEDMSHGWTQFPDIALGERERARKEVVLREAAEWVRDVRMASERAEALVDI